MKTEKGILTAFILNLLFSCFEFVGGMVTGSVAIASDAVHDLGDAFSIGAAYFLERKSKGEPDETYTYGYARYSVIGSMITTLILLLGSVVVLYHAVLQIISPKQINYNGMIVFAVIGVCVNLFAAMITAKGETLNRKAVNLHMLEDVLGWIVVLIGAVVMRFTDIALLDPILSVIVALFIGVKAAGHLKEAMDLFLEKVPRGMRVEEVKAHLLEVAGVLQIHHMHIWSLDGRIHCATMHIVTKEDPAVIRNQVRKELAELGIAHATLELETELEQCTNAHCHMEFKTEAGHHHHHHHHG